MSDATTGTARVLRWSDFLKFRFPGGDVGARHAVFIGGFSGSCHTHIPLARTLNQRFGAQVVTESLPRHNGDVREFRRSRAWHYRAEGVRCLDDHFKQFGCPMIVGGYSVGSLVAAYYALKHPERVKGLIMVSPALALASRYSALVGASVLGAYSVAPVVGASYDLYRISTTPKSERGRGHYVPWALLGTMAVRTLLGAVRVKRHPPQIWQTEEGPVISPHFAEIPLVVGASLLEFQLRMSILLRRLRVPTLVVIGDKDSVIDVPKVRSTLAQIGTVRIESFPDSGHQIMSGPEEQRYVDTIVRFCEELWR